MSARKLGRLTGLVLVLAAAVGGIGAASAAQYEIGGSTRAIQMVKLETIWT